MKMPALFDQFLESPFRPIAINNSLFGRDLTSRAIYGQDVKFHSNIIPQHIILFKSYINSKQNKSHRISFPLIRQLLSGIISIMDFTFFKEPGDFSLSLSIINHRSTLHLFRGCSRIQHLKSIQIPYLLYRTEHRIHSIRHHNPDESKGSVPVLC